MARRCFCPPDTFIPPWAISVLHPFGLFSDELTCLGNIGGQFQFLIAGVLIGIEQVAFDRAGEQVALLRNEADLLPQIVLGDLPDIDAIHIDGATGHLIEARDQADDGGFAGAGGAEKGGGLARLAVKLISCRTSSSAPGITEVHIAELDLALERLGNCLGSAGSLMSRFGFQALPQCGQPIPRLCGRMMNIIESIRKAKTICMAYCMKAIISPTCIWRLSHLVAPTQMISTGSRHS